MISIEGIIIDIHSRIDFYYRQILNYLIIPLTNLHSKIDYLKDIDKSIITCFPLVFRGAVAAKLLFTKDYGHVLRALDWLSFKFKLK